MRRTLITFSITLVLAVALPATANAALSITVPSSASLGSSSVGAESKSAQLGTVTASGSVLNLSWIATVSTSVFITGGGTPNETIAKSQIYYWSGPSTATTGVVLTNIPGQLTALLEVPLTTSKTAYTASGAVAFSVSWNPTIDLHIPAGAVAGTYTGTITHSVA